MGAGGMDRLAGFGIGAAALLALSAWAGGDAVAAVPQTHDFGLCPQVQAALDPNGDGNFDDGVDGQALVAVATCASPAEADANRAYVLRRMNRLPEATSAISASLSANPNSASARRISCMILRDNGDLAAALAACDRAIALRRNWGAAYLTRSGVKSSLKDYPGALADADRAIALGLNDADSLTVRGQILEDAGRPTEALAAFNDAIARDPTYVPARNAAGRVQFNQRQYDEAIATFTRSIGVRATAYAHLWRGRALDQVNRDDEALADFARAAELDPRWAWPAFYRGNVLADAGKTREAILAYDLAIKLDPVWGSPLVERSRMRERINDNTGAMADLNKAVEVAPRWVGARTARSSFHMQRGRYPEAIADAQQALGIDPKSASAWNNIGYSLYKTGDLNGALAAYDKALVLAPRQQPSLFWKARVLSELKRPQDAINTYTALLAVNPNYGWARANRGTLRVEVRDYAGAYDDLAWSIVNLPSYTDAWGLILMISNQAGYSHQETAARIEAAAVKAPGKAGPLFARSVLAFLNGDEAGSREAYNSAIQLDPQSPVLLQWGRTRGF